MIARKIEFKHNGEFLTGIVVDKIKVATEQACWLPGAERSIQCHMAISVTAYLVQLNTNSIVVVHPEEIREIY